jgi:pimeloyl-ACP methyl ester carboxylesterase
MAHWQSGDIEANGLRLHYTRTGGAKLPIMLAHGFSDDGLCWTALAEALALDYDVIMLDARGHGRSQAPARGYGPAEHAADLAGAITALGLHRPALLGHSMGAATALALAGTFPDVVRAILLEDPPTWWVATPEDSTVAEERRARMSEWITRLKGQTREQLLATQRAETPHWSEAELGPWADSKLRFNLNALNFGPATSVDWPALLRRITVPALLITADPARGAIVGDESAAALQALVPQLRVAHIAGAGHSIRRDQFEPYLQVVRAFLHETTRDVA